MLKLSNKIHCADNTCIFRTLDWQNGQRSTCTQVSWFFILLNFLSFDRSLTRPIAPATSMMSLLLQGKILAQDWNFVATLWFFTGREFDVCDSFFRANLIDYGTALNLTTYLTKETEYIAWSRVSSSIAYVRDMLSSNTELFPMFQVGSLLLLSQ